MRATRGTKECSLMLVKNMWDNKGSVHVFWFCRMHFWRVICNG